MALGRYYEVACVCRWSVTCIRRRTIVTNFLTVRKPLPLFEETHTMILFSRHPYMSPMEWPCIQDIKVILHFCNNISIMLPTPALEHRLLPASHFLGLPPASQHHRTGNRDPNASAAQPPIRHSPPSGVTGPRNLNRCGSRTSKYMLPLNIVIPMVNSDAATLFFGATEAVRRSTPEWTSCDMSISD